MIHRSMREVRRATDTVRGVLGTVILLAFGVFSTAPITAEIVIYDFTGTVTGGFRDSCGLTPNVGAPVEGTVQWDTEAPNLRPEEQDTGEYSQTIAAGLSFSKGLQKVLFACLDAVDRTTNDESADRDRAMNLLSLKRFLEAIMQYRAYCGG